MAKVANRVPPEDSPLRAGHGTTVFQGAEHARAELHRAWRRLHDGPALDDEEGCIETVEREAFVRRIEELATLVGVSNDAERLTGHRDW